MLQKFSESIISFYNEYVATGSNISDHASKNGITNTECYLIVKIGERLASQKNV